MAEFSCESGGAEAAKFIVPLLRVGTYAGGVKGTGGGVAGVETHLTHSPGEIWTTAAGEVEKAINTHPSVETQLSLALVCELLTYGACVPRGAVTDKICPHIFARAPIDAEVGITVVKRVCLTPTPAKPICTRAGEIADCVCACCAVEADLSATLIYVTLAHATSETRGTDAGEVQVLIDTLSSILTRISLTLVGGLVTEESHEPWRTVTDEIVSYVFTRAPTDAEVGIAVVKYVDLAPSPAKPADA